MELIRKRLSDISCFMQFFSEYIARRANREDGQRGRFFEQRYKATRLLDEGSLLACSVYVNLNPIRAGLAESPETSRYTSGFERIQALRAWQQQVGSRVPLGQLTEQEESQIESVLFVCPLRLTSGWALATMVPPNTYGAPRASDRGFLPLGIVDYLQLLDWTGRQLRHDKRGSIPSHLLPILDRLQVDSLHWLDIVDELPGVLRSAAGRRECLKQEAQRTGRQWVRGIGISREHFG